MAFHDEMGILVYYDDFSTVVILKINGDGTVLKSWIGGPKVDGVNTIRSGDLSAQGDLIIALTNDSLLVVDIDQTLDQQKWVYGEPHPTSFKNISWVAPLISEPSANIVFLKSDDQLAIYDLNTNLVLDSKNVSNKEILKFSKESNAHIVLRDSDLFSVIEFFSSKGFCSFKH